MLTRGNGVSEIINRCYAFILLRYYFISYTLMYSVVVLFDSQEMYNKYNLYIFVSIIFNHII